MANTALEQIKKLDDQRNKLLDQAKNEALTRAQEAIEDLNALGLSYVVVDSASAGRGVVGDDQERLVS